MATMELEVGEQLLMQKVGEYTNGSERFGGRINGNLFLTNQRFIFTSSKIILKIARLDVELPLDAIAQAKPIGPLFGLRILCKDGSYDDFRVTGRGAWVDRINSLLK